MRSFLLPIFCPFLLLGVTDCAQREKGGGSSATEENELVGGRPAVEGQFPATVGIVGNCIAAREGPRHSLLAAHCVTSEEPPNVDAGFSPGRTLFVASQIAIDQFADPATAPGARAVVVERTLVQPEWASSCRPGESVCVITNPEVPPDVAVVVLTPDAEPALAGVARATVDLTPVAAGEPLVVMGYGREEGVNVEFDYSRSRPKFAETVALAHGATRAARGPTRATRTASPRPGLATPPAAPYEPAGRGAPPTRSACRRARRASTRPRSASGRGRSRSSAVG
jgi:hypothetical protein